MANVSPVEQNKRRTLQSFARSQEQAAGQFERARERIGQGTQRAQQAQAAENRQIAADPSAFGSLIPQLADQRLADLAASEAGVLSSIGTSEAGASALFDQIGNLVPALESQAKVTGALEAIPGGLSRTLQEINEARATTEDFLRDQAETEDFSDSELRNRLLGAAERDLLAGGQAVAAGLETAIEGEEEARGLFEDVGRRLKAGTPALPASPAERELAQQALVRSEPIRRARETRPAARRLTEARRQTQALAQQAEQALAQPEPTADEVVQRAREIGVQEGFDPDRVFGILGPSQERTLTTAERSLDVAGVPETDIELADEADVTVDKLAEIRSGDRYADMKAEIVADIEAGRSWDEIEADARAGGSSAGFAGDASEESVIGRWPRTWRVLRAELRPFAPSLGDIRELEDAGFFDDEE